jgi:hypothetical protein
MQASNFETVKYSDKRRRQNYRKRSRYRVIDR